MIVPHTEISPDTLRALLEEIVSRDGTDYGAVELSMEQKVALARRQLEEGAAVLFWDEATESASLVDAGSVP